MNEKKISMIGSGYVGLVCGLCLTDFGYKIINVDNDHEKISALKHGEIPIYEPGLAELMKRASRSNSISFTTEMKKAIRESRIIMIAVGTPTAEDLSPELSDVIKVVRQIASQMQEDKIIVVKSTVPVGSCRFLARVVQKELDKRGINYKFDIVSNPEFLREGAAVNDFFNPDRVVFGSDNPKIESQLKEIYYPLYRAGIPFVFTSLESAEMIKYAANAFLATKISFINEIAGLCEETEADIRVVARGIGLDKRIGEDFLRAGPGYGGSCFPKDTRALLHLAKKKGVELQLVKASVEVNERQKFKMLDKITGLLDDVKGKTIAVLGVSFKAGTDDIRESPALTIIIELIKAGASIRLYDPAANIKAADFFRQYYSQYQENIEYCTSIYRAASGVRALLCTTAWEEFKGIDLVRLKKIMAEPIIFDFHNLYNPAEVGRYGIKHIGVGISREEKRQVEDR